MTVQTRSQSADTETAYSKTICSIAETLTTIQAFARTATQRNKTMSNAMIDSADYPPARIVHDIFTLSQEFWAVGLDAVFSATTNLKGYSTVSVSIFDEKESLFFRLALYGHGDTKELNELYDALFEFLRENKPDSQAEF